MKILLTGGNGYIGRNILSQISNKYEFLSPSQKELDLLDTKAVENYFKKHTIDIVIHAALIGGSRKEEYVTGTISQNLLMFFNIMRCKKNFKKMIFLGSGAEYDKSNSITQVLEDDFDKSIPKDEYGLFKYICSKYIEKSEDIINLRIFGLFGQHEDYRYRFISNAICRNLCGLPITINQNCLFTYVYINDIIHVIDYFITHKPKFAFYNIGDNQKHDLISIAKKINNLSNLKSRIIVKKRGFQNEYTCNSQRLIEEMKNFSFADFDKSIYDLYQWYKKNKQIIKKEEL